MIKSLLKNSLFNLLKVLSLFLFPLISYSYVTHILKVDGIGMIEFSKSFTSFFVMLSMLGIVGYGTREAAKLRNNKYELSKFTHEIIIINIFSIIISLLLFISIIFISPFLIRYKSLLLINSLLIVFSALGLEWFYAAIENYYYIAIRTILVQIIFLLLTLVLINDPNDIYLYAFLQTFSIISPSIINITYIRKYIIWKFLGNYDIMKHLSKILLFFLMTISVQIFSSLDLTMLGFMSGHRSVGLYTAATKMTNMASSLVVSIISVLSAKLSIYVHNEDWLSVKKISYKTINIILIISIPSALLLSLLSADLIKIFSGPSFVAGDFASKILSLRVFLSPINTFFIVQLLISMNLERKNLVTTSVAALLNLFLNFILIPKFSQNGAAIATVSAELIELGFNLFFIKEIISARKVLFKIIKYMLISSIILICWHFLTLFFSGNILLIVFPFTSMFFYILILVIIQDEILLDIKSFLSK